MTDEDQVSVDRAEPGCWMPPDQAARELGMSERLVYRLAKEGKLQSREDADDGVRVWVADADRVDEARDQAVEVVPATASLLTAERLSSALSHQVAALTAAAFAVRWLYPQLLG